MLLDYFDRYIWEAEAHANELLELIDPDRRQSFVAVLIEDWDELLPQFLNPPKAAFVFLGEDPTQQERRLSRLTEAEVNLLWAQARFLALLAASSLRQAAKVATVKGMKYRAAVRHAAQASLPFQGHPTPEDIALLQLPA